VQEGLYFNGHYYYKAEETVIANTVADQKNKKGEVVVHFCQESAEGTYKLIEVPQVRPCVLVTLH